jgi:dTDP-4-dehydrorhamnose reductase
MILDVELKRVLVLGGGGLLGGALGRIWGAAGVELLAPPRAQCDVCSLDALRAQLSAAGPLDLLVNAAAQAFVNQAQEDPDGTFAVNALGAHNAALAAAAADLPLLQISTDYVFDGRTREPYREHHPTGTPPSVYGQSKLLGERLVRGCCSRHFIVRVAALFGAGRQTFVDWVLERADPLQPLTIVDDRIVSPSWTDDLARQLLALVNTPYHGTYHASGHGAVSWYGLARAALELAGRDPAGVQPVASDQLDEPAVRPAYSALDNHLLRLRGLDTMLPWREALAAYLAGR